MIANTVHKGIFIEMTINERIILLVLCSILKKILILYHIILNFDINNNIVDHFNY